MVSKSTLQIIIEAITGDAVKGIDNVDKELKNLGKTSETTGKNTGKVGTAIGGIQKAVGGLITSGLLLKAGGMLIDFFKSSIVEAEAAAVAQAQLAAVIKSTGGAAGVTADAINKMAGEFSKTTGVEDDLIVKNSALLLTFTNIGKTVFPQAMQAAIDMSAVMGQDLQSSVTMLGKALNDPIDGVTALKRVGVDFNDEARVMIANMVESGDVMGAQNLILQEMQKEFSGAAKAMNDASTKSANFKNSVGNLKEALGAGLLPAVRDVTTTVGGWIDAVTASIEAENALTEAEKAGIITRDEATRVINDMTWSGYSAADAMVWLEEKTEGASGQTLDMRDALAENATNLRDEALAAKDAELAIAGVETKTLDASTAMQDYSTKLLFNLASAGLDDDAQLALAFSLGLVDNKTAQAMMGVEGLTEKYDLNKNGAIDAGLETTLYAGAVKALNDQILLLKDKTVNITANVKKTGDWSWTSPGGGGTVEARAVGGPVSANTPYIVGESGPELFVPTQAGTILPNVVNNFSINMTSGRVGIGEDVLSTVRLLELLYG
ncbi:MAG: phage tail length tape measure family protein [Candidatus Paceibacterota bacterium]